MHGIRSRDDARWVPTSRVRVAQLKLSGVHPVAVLGTEIMERKHNVRGSKLDLRNVVKSIGSSVADEEQRKALMEPMDLFQDRGAWDGVTVDGPAQVQALIDLATEPAVLIRQWAGWKPFM
jgi:hypothetical protein